MIYLFNQVIRSQLSSFKAASSQAEERKRELQRDVIHEFELQLLHIEVQ